MVGAAQASISCRRCGGTDIHWSSDLSEHDKATFAAKARENKIGSMKFARASFAMSLKDAKALALHVSDSGNRCHRCHGDIALGTSVCGPCNSANLNW